VPIAADSSVAVPELTRLCRELMAGKKAGIEARASEIKKRHDDLRAKWQSEARGKSDFQAISTAFLAYEIGEAIKKHDWVLVNGSANGWARKLWDFTKPRQHLGTSGGAGLGYGMGAAIGAALALKDSGTLAVDIQADGDFLMTSSALWTAAKHRIPLLVVMHNNQSFYNSEEHGIQIAKHRKRPVENAGIGTHVDDPAVDYAQVARGFGLHAEGPISKPSEVRPAIERALKIVQEKKLPALVDVISEPR
jgi:thiamine pyrophosphate-dependent acetolactate synthase large subunit-like protein